MSKEPDRPTGQPGALRIIWLNPVSHDNQALYLNAIPLLATASLYLAAALALTPEVWRERRRVRDLDYVLALLFPCIGVAAAIVGAQAVRSREPLMGNAWLSLAAIVVATLPAVMFLVRWTDRRLLLTGTRRALEAEERSTVDERRRDDMKTFADTLGRTRDAHAVARLLAARASSDLGSEFACVWTIDGRRAEGCVALLEGVEQAWFAEAVMDLQSEPSAVASVVFDVSPLVIYDAAESPLVNPRIGAIVRPKSGLFAPLVAGEQVIAVLGVVSVGEQRRFASDEVRLVEELCSEAALALERARSAAALERALERERLVARVAHQVRSELSVPAVLSIAVAETGRALGASRAVARLARDGRPVEAAAEWRETGAPALPSPAAGSGVAERAAARRTTVVIDDVAASPHVGGDEGRDELLGIGVRAVVATPIVVSGSLLGVLEAHRATAGVWQHEDVEFAEAVAREVALAVETARLLEENEVRLRQQAALLDAAQVVTSELEPGVVLSRLVEEVARLVEADAADFYVLEPERGSLRCAAVEGLPGDVVGFEFPADRGVAGAALARGRAVLASDYGRSIEPVAHPAYEGFRHVMVAPVTWGGEPRGVLGVGARPGTRPFDERDLDLLETFAGLAALALRNARAFEERTRQAQVQRGFFRMASVLAEPLSLPATLEAVAQAAAEATGGSSAAVLGAAPDGLELVGAHALPEELRSALARAPLSDRALGDAARAGRILAVGELARDERIDPGWRDAAVRAGVASALAIPVERRDAEQNGVVLVFFPVVRRFTDDDVALARQLAGAARGALERASLFEEERRARGLAQQLARTGSLLASELDPAVVLDEVVRRAPGLLEVEACVIRVVEDHELVISAAEGEHTEELLGLRSQAGGRLSGEVAQTQLPVTVADAGADTGLGVVDPLLAMGFRSFLGVPLAGREGALHGVLAVYGRRPRTWRGEEIEALRALAGNAVAALSNAELYQRVALANERSNAILTNIADGIVAVNRDGAVVLWNRAAEEVTRVPAAEALGRTPSEVLGRGLETDGGEPEPGDRLVRIVRGDEEVWLSVTEAVMRDPRDPSPAASTPSGTSPPTASSRSSSRTSSLRCRRSSAAR